jgi:CheY-like chemotaxis protein
MSSRRLLLVDDDPQMAFLLGVLARRAELLLDSSGDVESAWARVQANPPDLVLLDINLPGPSGLELLRRRRESAGVSVAVALFCQARLDHVIAAGWRAGADYLLTKDLVTRPIDWRRRVEEILDDARGQGPILSLGLFTKEKTLPLSAWGGLLNQVFDHSALDSLLGPAVIEQVLCRALVCGFHATARRSWLVEGAGRLACDKLSLSVSPESVGACLESVRRQVWRLLGSGPWAAFDDVLRAGIANLCPSE